MLCLLFLVSKVIFKCLSCPCFLYAFWISKLYVIYNHCGFPNAEVCPACKNKIIKLYRYVNFKKVYLSITYVKKKIFQIPYPACVFMTLCSALTVVQPNPKLIHTAEALWFCFSLCLKYSSSFLSCGYLFLIKHIIDHTSPVYKQATFPKIEPFPLLSSSLSSSIAFIMHWYFIYLCICLV